MLLMPGHVHRHVSGCQTFDRRNRKCGRVDDRSGSPGYADKEVLLGHGRDAVVLPLSRPIDPETMLSACAVERGNAIQLQSPRIRFLLRLDS